MKDVCGLHCGEFTGVSPILYKQYEAELSRVFSHKEFDSVTKGLKLCGAHDLEHEPAVLTDLFNLLAAMLETDGKGRILLSCGFLEVCFLRQNMWKLVSLPVPEDPFDGVRIVR